jgi:predicted Zn-dependent protease
VLIALGKPDLALPHLQKACSLNPQNEVSYYLLSQAYRVLGNEGGQEKALAEFKRLQSQRLLQEKQRQAGTEALSPREVTKQELDAKDAP